MHLPSLTGINPTSMLEDDITCLHTGSILLKNLFVGAFRQRRTIQHTVDEL